MSDGEKEGGEDRSDEIEEEIAARRAEGGGVTPSVDEETAAKATEEVETSSRGQQASEQPEWVYLAFERLDEITTLMETWQTEQRQTRARLLRHRETIVVVAAATLLGLIGISAWMTYNGALSGDAFTFVLGALFGSLVTFLQNMLRNDASQA